MSELADRLEHEVAVLRAAGPVAEYAINVDPVLDWLNCYGDD